MSKVKKLFNDCMSRDLNVSLTYQREANWPVEIYQGCGKKPHKSFFYVDGEIRKKDAVNMALEFLKVYDKNYVSIPKIRPEYFGINKGLVERAQKPNLALNEDEVLKHFWK